MSFIEFCRAGAKLLPVCQPNMYTSF
jgi:hypothetical protein